MAVIDDVGIDSEYENITFRFSSLSDSRANNLLSKFDLY